MSVFPCAVWTLVLLSAVWTSAVNGRIVDDLAAEKQGLDIHTRTKRYLCRYGEFHCVSGQCTPSISPCNGVADCADMSDEAAEMCSFMECPSNTFRCAYGACVDDKLQCDGRWDCVDGSDENYSLCYDGEKTHTPVTHSEETSTTVTWAENTPSTMTWPENNPSTTTWAEFTQSAVTRPKNQCFLPKMPKYGWFSVDGCERNDTSPLCSGVEGTPVLQLTSLKFGCRVTFTIEGSPSAQCKEGIFTPEPPTCKAGCGILFSGFSFGNTVFRPNLPWMVAIYRNSTRSFNMTQICAGSLVSDRLVVSAAHCFWDHTRHTQQPKELFKFAFGKYFRSWDATETMLQVRDAKEIAVHERYQGRRLNHGNDIAVIVLDTRVDITTFVRPICIDWRNKYEDVHLEPNFTGTVAGWGYTEKGEPSETLMAGTLPVIDFKKCWDTIADKLRPYLTNDKFCAGYINGTGARAGDSGSGFIFEKDSTWYLRGIVSVGESNVTNTNAYSAFTNVGDFLNFIEKFLP